MKIIALLNWYAEEDQLLRDCITSLAPLAPDIFICVDGPYALYPSDEVRSPDENYDAILDACLEIGAEANIYTPTSAWAHNEVGKRKHMLGMALEQSDTGDFLYITDADYRAHRIEENTRSILEQTDHKAAEIGFFEGRTQMGKPAVHRARLFMRADPTLHLRRNHYQYWYASNTLGSNCFHHILGRDSTLPALDLTHQMVVEHRCHHRDKARRAAQIAWYEARDSQGLER